MNREELLNDLRAVPEMDPDEHDGSYELMREIVASYKTLGDYSQCNFRDLNAIYMMAIGTWKLNAEKKKDYVKQGHLSDAEKSRMEQVIDRIWDNACHSKYQNREQNKPSIGMFGTGFYSFQNKTTDECAQAFIKMLVDIADMQYDNEMFDRAAQVLTDDFKGMKAASASVVLHCLKPKTFPILNGNMGAGNIFGTLGVNLKRPADIGTYIENCRQIKEFRDANLSIENYRILDQWVGKLDKYQDDEYIPSLKEYDPGLSREQYEELLTDENVIKRSSLDTLYYIYKMGGEASCKEVADRYGNSPQHYNSNATYVAKRIFESTRCPLSTREGESGDRYWSILFQGRYAKKEENGAFIWHMRKPLMDAMETIDDDGFFEEFEKMVAETSTGGFELNTILYGPPGTGKTYNTVIYAVAIVEKKTLDEVKNEAAGDYDAVKKRFDEYKESGRIAFTTFHQSYGYEEFIEGIKPRMSEDDAESDLDYSVEAGVFKDFCDKACAPAQSDNENYGFNKSPVVWKVSLAGTYENAIREECLRNSHIRIGWDGYGQEITDDMNYDHGGKAVLNAFMNKMKIGDIVLSCYTSSSIDAIGVITGDYEWDDSFDEYKRVRKVNWIAKGFNEDIVELNGGSTMTLSTVYRMKITVGDVMKLISKVKTGDTEVRNVPNEDNYVFVIDEINRGNISKIFGELITLIEGTKRLGAEEEMTVKLPYSPNKPFGVPQNVYILGTMNTADRSIALMDTALRRRFSFIEMMPEPQILRSIGADKVQSNGQTLDVAAMLEIINRRIEYLYDREHTIGHAFFTGLKKDPSIDKLATIFEKSVIPLLQEYFYEDYGKIQLVLGDDGKQKEEDKQYQFIRDTEVKPAELFNTVPDMESQTKKYEIQKSAFRKIESYKKIGKGL